MLNIGPGPDGELDPVAYQCLHDIGAWIKINGEAIYGSRVFSTFAEGEDIHYTQSKDKKTQFVFLSSFPEKSLVLTKIPFEKNTKVQMLGASKKLSWKKTEGGIQVNIPAEMKKNSPFMWVLKVES